MNRLSKRILVGVVAALVLAIGALVVILLTRPPEQVPPTPPKQTPVRVRVAERRDLADMLTLPGRLEPWRAATLAAAKPGTLTDLRADKGDVVAAGQTLARVDHRAWEASVARARTEVDDANRQLARLKALLADGAVSSNDLDQAQARSDTGHAALAEVETWYAQCTVSAPFPGVINDRFVQLGDFIPEGGRVFELIDHSRVKVALDIPERDVAALAPDAPVTFTLAALGGETHTGRVNFVAAAASRTSNAFHVELAADNPGGRLRPGMIADVAVPRGFHRQRIVLPLESVLPMRGEHMVFVVVDGHALRRIVKLAAIVGDEAVLESGVEPGDQIVVEGQRALADGVPVQIP